MPVTKLLKNGLLALSLLAPACGAPTSAEPADAPFAITSYEEGKEDTAYQNPDGIEVEVDLEGDVTAPSWNLADAPAVVGQFALTYFRTHGEFYLESLAEDASSDTRVEWLVDSKWITAKTATSVDTSKLTHFRLRGVNAVALHGARSTATLGKVYTAKVPQKPFSVMADAGETCADPDAHIGLSQDVYWYQWNPDKAGCQLPMNDLKVTVSKVFPAQTVVYPEYNRLVADKKVTVVVLFGLIGDEIADSDPGIAGPKTMASGLLRSGFKEVPNAPVGKRYAKTLRTGTVVEVDLYSAREFAGLDDYAHFGNLEKAIAEHEIVVYDGHSMLGASDYWTRPTYPKSYQIFLYGGCLGYEYYVKPIVEGKGGWQNVDIMSSVVEVSANANEFATPALARIFYGLEHGFTVSWTSILKAVRTSVGDSTFGVSGVRDNCFSPRGNRC
jgi:hypothetical protein